MPSISAKTTLYCSLLALLGSCCYVQGHCGNCTVPVTATVCQCDVSCSAYNDCCRDAPTANDSSTRLETVCQSASSSEDRVNGYHMIRNCSATRTNDCFDNGYSPVTDINTNLTYSNYYCAMCNNITERSLQTWTTIFTCDHNDKELYCSLCEYTAPLNVSTRPCYQTISDCSITSNLTLVQMCIDGLYEPVIDRNDTIYYNDYCSRCNGVFDARCLAEREIEEVHCDNISGNDSNTIHLNL